MEVQMEAVAPDAGEGSSQQHCDEIPEGVSSRQIQGNFVSESVQTDWTEHNLCGVFSELNFSNGEIDNLLTKLETMELSENYFKNNDIKTCYFTGLSACLLFIIHDMVSPYLPSQPDAVLSTFQQLLLTLMKLRLNLPFEYLSYRFAISLPTTHRYFYETLHVLYCRFRSLVFWPERKILEKNIPACFRESFADKFAVIIDCFEVSIEGPSTVLDTSRTKHQESVKFLIGITPQGTMSYISEACDGRTSDKILFENSGFSDLILPGDIVLTDRSFFNDNSLETPGVILNISAFIMEKKQLCPIDLENTRNTVILGINVRRMIGILKREFQVFNQTIPVSMLSKQTNGPNALDKMVLVCSAFINLCSPQIPLN